MKKRKKSLFAGIALLLCFAILPISSFATPLAAGGIPVPETEPVVVDTETEAPAPNSGVTEADPKAEETVTDPAPDTAAPEAAPAPEEGVPVAPDMEAPAASNGTVAAPRALISLQITDPETQTIVQPNEDREITYTFLALNVDILSFLVKFTAVSSRGYEVEVAQPSLTLLPGTQVQIKVKETIPKGAAIGQEKLTLSANLVLSAVKVYGNAITNIVAPPDTTPPIIRNVSYTKNKAWVKDFETVSFRATDAGANASGLDRVEVKDPSGTAVTVADNTGGNFSFAANKSGVYSIRAYDKAGNASDITYTKQINVDAVLPALAALSITPKGAGTYIDIKTTPIYAYFDHKNNEISLSATDAESGVSKISYQYVAQGGTINEAGWTVIPLASPLPTRNATIPAPPDFAATPAGSFIGSIAVRVEDAVGNIFTTAVGANGKFVNEAVLPTVSLTMPSGFDPTKWYDSVVIGANASDAGSGLARVEIQRNGTTANAVSPVAQANGLGAASATASYTLNTPGASTMGAAATDKSGNSAQSATQTVKICNLAPTLTVAPDPSASWTNSSLSFTLSNGNTGVYSPITYSYQVGGGAWTDIGTLEPNVNASLVLNANVNATYTFRATTATGKVSNLVTKTVRIDKTTPAAAAITVQAQTAGTPVNTADGTNGWYKTLPVVAIAPPAADPNPNESPVKTMFRFGTAAGIGGAAFIEYTGTNSPLITARGQYALEVYTVDAAGNASAHTTRYINVDNASPVPDAANLRLEKMDIGDVTGIWDLFALFSGNVKVSVPIADDMSGLGSVSYQLLPDGGAEGTPTLCSQAGGSYFLTVSPQFKGKVRFLATDQAGNSATTVSGALIADAQQPTTPTLNTNGYAANAWTKDAVTLSVDGSSSLSGIKGYYCKANGGAETAIPVGGLLPPEGATSYEIYAVNNLGVKSGSVNITVKRDAALPKITATAGVSTPTNGGVPVALSYEVGVSGASQLTISIDGGAPKDISSVFAGGTTGSVTLMRNGTYTFTIVNGAGVSVTTTLVITNIDTTAPQTAPTYTVDPDALAPDGIQPWRNATQTFKITSAPQDGGSTVKTYYRLYLDGTAAPAGIEYTGTDPIVSTNGVYRFELWAQDAAGNSTSHQTRTIFVDVLNPTVTITPNGGTIANSVEVSLDALDTGGSGIRSIKYELLDTGGNVIATGTRVPPFPTIYITAEFDGKIRVTAYDAAGNASAPFVSETFAVTASIPVTVTAARDGYGGGWTNTNVTYDLRATAAVDYTVIGYEYSADDGATWSPIVDYDSVAGTAFFTVSAAGESGYLFRVKTDYDDGTVHEERFGVPTQKMIARIDKQAPNAPVSTIAQTPVSGDLYGSAITVTLAATDNPDPGSGIAQMEYSLNGTDWNLYAGPFTIAPQFSGKISTRATDGAGNLSAVLESAQITVDAARPARATVGAVSGGNPYTQDMWATGAVTLSFSGGEPSPLPVGFSGIDHYSYSTNGGVTWTDGAGITINTNGSTTVLAKAVSEAGVQGPVIAFTVKIDSVPAGFTLSPPDTSAWTNQNITFTFTADAGIVSPYRFEYRKTGDPTWTALPSNTFTASEEGNLQYDFQIVTGTGTSVKTGISAKIDKTAPAQAAATVTGTMGADNWYTTLPTLTVDTPAADGGSPIKAEASLYPSGGIPPVYSQNPLSITADGTYILDLRATDDAGNVTYTDSRTIKVDTTRPTASISFLSAPIVGTIFGGAVRVDIQGSDTSSGIANLEYKLVPDTVLDPTTVPWSPYVLLYVNPQFRGDIYARATDAAGNVSVEVQQAVTADIETPGAPTLSATQNGAPYASDTWASGPVIMTITPPNPAPLSGINHYEYFDGSAWHSLAPGVTTFTASANGKTDYEVRAVSNAGFAGTAASFEVWIDSAKPILSATPAFADGSGMYTPGVWTNKDVKITLQALSPAGVRYYDSFGGDHETGPEVLLQGDSSAAGDQHSFTARNNAVPSVTSDPVPILVKIDKTAPAQPDVSTSTPNGLAGWFKTPGSIAATIPAAGGGSPETTEYAVDGGAWIVYNAGNTIPFNAADGTHSYTLRTRDEAGNVSVTDSIQAQVDHTAPSGVTYSFLKADGTAITPDADGSVRANQAVYVKITGADATSGMRSITYDVGSGEQTQQVSPDSSVIFALPVNFDGTVRATKAIDVAGNENISVTESPRIVIRADGRPVVTAAPRTQPGEDGWYTEAVTFDLTAQSDTFGLKEVEIKVNGIVVKKDTFPTPDVTLKPYVQAITSSGRSQVIEITATDIYGNQTTVRQAANIETEKPTVPMVRAVTKDASGNAKAYNGEWTNQSVYFQLSAFTAPSGIAWCEYQTSTDGQTGWSAWKPISEPLTQEHQAIGNQVLYYRFHAVSNVGRESDPTAPLLVRIDTDGPQPPSVTVTGPKDGNGNYTQSPVITITMPVDGGPGNTKVCYEIVDAVTGAIVKQGCFDPPGGEVTGLDPGSYVIRTRTQDEGGNRSEEITTAIVINSAQDKTGKDGTRDTNGDGSTGSGSTNSDGGNAPRTGDSENLLLWLALAAGAATALAWTFRKKNGSRKTSA